jgi:tRNA1(Val) A37 N6-methylase TrmN6
MLQKQDFFTVMDGQVKFVRGMYNITSDAVWLGAFANAHVGGDAVKVLDVGIGTGGISLCWLAQNPNMKITGLEISKEMLAECAENAKLNGCELELINADIYKWKTSRTFDIVITNPPYFKGTPRYGASVRASFCPDAGPTVRESVQPHHNINLFDWTKQCVKRLRPRGYFFTIVDGGASAEVIAALHAGKAGAIEILPLFGSKNSAERILIKARLGVRTGTKIYNGKPMNGKAMIDNPL